MAGGCLVAVGDTKTWLILGRILKRLRPSSNHQHGLANASTPALASTGLFPRELDVEGIL